jgi:hypothetical protein
MKRRSILIMCSAAILSITALFGAPALAQQKTVKACEDEWRANKDANQAAKITEKAYVEKCRADAEKPAAATTAAPAKPVTPTPAVAAPAKPPAAPAAAPASSQKTVKACEEEWRANKDANQAAKISEKAYIEKCRAEPAMPAAATTTPAKPAAPAAATKTQAPPPAPAVATPAKPAAPAPAVTAPAMAKTGANEYATEAQAKARCGADTVVYVNLSSKIYHFAGHKDYGTLKNGTYMCEKETAGVGARAAKDEKHP